MKFKFEQEISESHDYRLVLEVEAGSKDEALELLEGLADFDAFNPGEPGEFVDDPDNAIRLVSFDEIGGNDFSSEYELVEPGKQKCGLRQRLRS